MFDHVHHDWLDQRKYPWVSLTEAAIYLISPDDDARLAAVNSHDWEHPFNRLREWIVGGKITVYEAWHDGPCKPIPKEEFFGVLIKYPSYPEAKQRQIGLAFMPGGKAFIQCNLARRPKEVVFDRYFEKGKSEPRWRDLKVRSEELVAALKASNIEAAAELEAMVFPTDPPDQIEEEDHQQTAKPGRKPEFNWELIETECHRLMDHHGYFDVSDPEWDCQARLEEALKRFCQDNWQREPAGSTLRQRLPEWISAWRWRKTGDV